MSSPMSSKVSGTRSSSGNGHQPPVVRQLKPPPEIWELVHPVTTPKPKPIRSFLWRVMSNWTTLVFLAFVVGVGAGVGIALWKHPGARAFFSSLQRQAEIPPPKPVVTEPAPAPVQNSSAPVATSTETPAPSTETQPAATSEAAAVSTETQPAANGSSTHPFVKRVTLPRQTRTPDAALGVRVGSSSTANTAQPTESPKTTERKSTESAGTKPKSNADGSQVIAPVKAAPATKAKVIQWP